MKKTRFIILKLERILLPACIYAFTIFLVLFSSDNLSAAKSGLSLWVSSVIPSLLPFFIATELLSYTNIVSILGRFLNKIMRPLFNVPGEGSFALIMGILSGYPVGAKIVSNFKSQGICTIPECERLLAFTNNSGPLFIIGTVGVSLFSSSKVGFQLFLVHFLSCICVGFLFRWWKPEKKHLRSSSLGAQAHQYIKFNNLGAILSKSIQNAISSVVMIGGFVILFSVIISMLNSSGILILVCKFLEPLANIFGLPTKYIPDILIGLIEVTNGVKLVSNSGNLIICSFLLGFGGISVMLQVLSITSKAGISIKPYILGKFLQACFSVIFMWLIL